MEPTELTVIGKVPVAADTVRLRLRRVDGQPLPDVEPGAHVALELNGHVRRYSLLSADAAPRHIEIAVLRTSNAQGGSRFIHDRLDVGDRLTLLDVANDFPLNADAPHVLLLGGGIGITPLLSMAARLGADRRSFALHQVVRDTTRQWPRSADVQAVVHVGRDALDVRRLIADQPHGSHVQVCGPAGLVGAVRTAAADADWDARRVHAESFGASAGARDSPLRVTLRRSGLTLDVAPGHSLLDALLDAGVWTSHECRRGICGSCLAEVVRGRPIHRDGLAANLRQGAMCTCVSWAEGPELELDL